MSQIAPTIPTAVEATPRRSATKTRRDAVIARDGPLCAGKGCSEIGIELDHRIPLALSGKDELANWQLMCRLHHLAKTAIDVAIIAHVKRIHARQDGTRRERKVIPARVDPWPRGRKLQSRGFGK